MRQREQYRLGMAAYNASRFAEAIDQLAPLASGKNDTMAILCRFYVGQAHYRLGLELFEQKWYREAGAHFESAARYNTSHTHFAQYLAACYIGEGRLDRATGALNKLLNENPDDVDVRVRCALATWKQGEPIEAMFLLRDGISRHPASAELHYQLGVMHASNDELDDARRMFEKAIEIDSDHAHAHERLAQCLSARGHHERALDCLEQAHALAPTHPRIAWQLSVLAQSLSDSGRETRMVTRTQEISTPSRLTLDQLSNAIVAEPDFIEAFLSLPESDIDHEVFATLAMTLERALERFPEFADLHYHCGQVYRRLGLSEKALDAASTAVGINPHYVNALLLMAQLYSEQGENSAGIRRLEQAIAAGGDYPDVHYLMGSLYQRGGQSQEARSAFNRALELNGEFAQARAALEVLGV